MSASAFRVRGEPGVPTKRNTRSKTTNAGLRLRGTFATNSGSRHSEVVDGYGVVLSMAKMGTELYLRVDMAPIHARSSRTGPGDLLVLGNRETYKTVPAQTWKLTPILISSYIGF